MTGRFVFSGGESGPVVGDPFCSLSAPVRCDPTPTQWRCLVALHRFHGNRKEAGPSIGMTAWTLGSHIRAMCARCGFDDWTDASLFFAEELRRAVVTGQEE